MRFLPQYAWCFESNEVSATGVSPWYWWADVAVTTHDTLYVSAKGCAHGSPSVKYRGIFLNDEQPALQNWAMKTFTNGTGSAATGSPFNAQFYAKLYVLSSLGFPTSAR